MTEGRTHGRVTHSGGRRNVSDSAGGATDGHRSVALTLHSAGDFRRLSAAWSAHIEVEGSGEVGTSCDVALVGSMILLAGLSALGTLALPKMASKAYLIFLPLILFTT